LLATCGPMEPEAEAPAADDEYVKGKDLVFAARTGDLDAVRTLLLEGTPVGFRDTREGADGWTALKWAASEGHEEVLALLLEHDAALEEAKFQEEAAAEGSSAVGTPLHWAAYKGHLPIVWRLLTAKPKFLAKDLDAELNTPLHLAAAGGHLLVLKTMLSEGVDVNMKNAYGNFPVQLSTSAECQALLRDAAAAAKDGRYYLCSCSGEFCTEEQSVPDVVIDRVSSPNKRSVRYSNSCAAQIRSCEDALTLAMKAADVPKLESAIKAAEEIGVSLPMIEDATADLLRQKAQISLLEEVALLQEKRPVSDRALLRPMMAPLKQAREAGVAANIIADAEGLCETVDAEATLADVMGACQPFKMTDTSEEEGVPTEPPSGESDFARRADAIISKLIDAIERAQKLQVKMEVTETAEIELNHLSAEADLRKALLVPKEGSTEDGTKCWTQHNGTQTYSALEDLVFRNDFLDSSIEKCVAAGTTPGIMLYGQKAQKDLKADLKVAQAEDEERKAKEAKEAAKAAKKGKKKK